jgi:hypothetical protein
MAHDVAREQVVLFGGFSRGNFVGDTWTWDGTDWTERSPAHSPAARSNTGMAYDADDGQVMLFGGASKHGALGDTWAWDGADWTERTPAHSPSPRAYFGMAYDGARAQVVLFGGQDSGGNLVGDTWTWDGTDWSRHFTSSIRLTPRSGPPGTVIDAHGSGFAASETVKLVFVDSTAGRVFLKRVTADATGAFTTHVTIPITASPGKQPVKAKGLTSAEVAKHGFTVT